MRGAIRLASWHAACYRYRLSVSLKQGAGTIRTQTLAVAQRRRGAGQAAGSGGTPPPCGFSAGGAGADTKLWCGGMKTNTHQGALPDSLHGGGGGFYVTGARGSCRVVSIAARVCPCDTSILPPTSVFCSYSSPARTAVLHLVLERVLHHKKTAAVPYVLLLLHIRTRCPSITREVPPGDLVRLPVPYGLRRASVLVPSTTTAAVS